jgi:hypothetical protein
MPVVYSSDTILSSQYILDDIAELADLHMTDLASLFRNNMDETAKSENWIVERL